MFDQKILDEADALVAQYPDHKSALLPLLHLAQRELGWVSPEAQAWAAERLELSPIMVQGVTSFYTMFNQKPVGRYHIQLCKTLSCKLRGAVEMRQRIRERIGIGPGETSSDGKFTLTEVECLGACGTAPAMMVGESYHEQLSVDRLDEILDALGVDGGKS